MAFARLADHTILLSGIVPGAIVIDAGFNHGEFSRALLTKVDCRIIALEPLPDLVRDAAPEPRIVLIQKALASATGQRRFHEFQRHCASLHLHGDGELKTETIVEAISLSDLLSEHRIDRVAVLKLDIEGEEIDVLLNLHRDLLKKIEQITIEFHFSHFPSHREEFNKIVRLLSSVGFLRHNFSTRPGTDTLFLQRNLIGSMAPRLRLLSAGYRLGLQRIIGRYLS